MSSFKKYFGQLFCPKKKLILDKQLSFYGLNVDHEKQKEKNMKGEKMKGEEDERKEKENDKAQVPLLSFRGERKEREQERGR